MWLDSMEPENVKDIAYQSFTEYYCTNMSILYSRLIPTFRLTTIVFFFHFTELGCLQHSFIDVFEFWLEIVQ